MTSFLSIADRIREIMQHRGLNQKDLADEIGISQPAISLYLKGRMPPADILYRIARLGNRTMEWLLNGEESFAVQGLVNEPPVAYGNRQTLLDLWEQLPNCIRKDFLTLFKHIAEMQSHD